MSSAEASTRHGENPDREIWRTLASRAAASFGSPCYLSRWRPVEALVAAHETRVGGVDVKAWLSFKTHPVQPLAVTWMRSGRGIEVVSEAEFVAVRALGCPTAQLLVNGVAKHSWLARYDVAGLRVHFDSTLEVDSLIGAAVAQRWHVGLRCHVPDEHDARDADFGGQFGLDADEFCAMHERLIAAGATVEGVHFHLGQATRSLNAYTDSMSYVATLCKQSGLSPRYIDCGGGVDASPDVSSSLRDLRRAIAAAAQRLPSLREIWTENGRHITRSSAALIVRVLDVKVRPECRYLICDGGRTNHGLDADNGVHDVIVHPERRGSPVLTTVAGPTCMTDDRLGRLMLPDDVGVGDLIIWLDAGAYYLPWETRFSHGLCAVAWADADEHISLARARETPQQWSYLWTANA